LKSRTSWESSCTQAKWILSYLYRPSIFYDIIPTSATGKDRDER
jgi:hypothetical protein